MKKYYWNGKNNFLKGYLTEIHLSNMNHLNLPLESVEVVDESARTDSKATRKK